MGALRDDLEPQTLNSLLRHHIHDGRLPENGAAPPAKHSTGRTVRKPTTDVVGGWQFCCSCCSSAHVLERTDGLKHAPHTERSAPSQWLSAEVKSGEPDAVAEAEDRHDSSRLGDGLLDHTHWLDQKSELFRLDWSSYGEVARP